MRVITNIAKKCSTGIGRRWRVRWILSDSANSGTLFQIKDNGPGIPESIRDTIFDAFTTSGKPEGTGLGLAIVRRVVEDHGGSSVLYDRNWQRDMFHDPPTGTTGGRKDNTT